LVNNRLIQCASVPTQPRLGLSYFVPPGYWGQVPANERIPAVHQGKTPVWVDACQRVVSAEEQNAYEFQTEQMLTAGGLNIYDGSLRSMALGLLDDDVEAHAFLTLMDGGATCQFPDVRGDAVCKGVLSRGTCDDPNHTGNCGFCYGDGTPADSSLPKANAWTFRMISDYWAFDGTVDARCPEKEMQWTWNDYRPVLGENSWANLLAPLQVAIIKYETVPAIPADHISILMSRKFLKALEKMFIQGVGGVYYAPKNTLAYGNYDMGYEVSVENNISLLAGLNALRYIFSTKNIHLDQLGNINMWITGIETFIKNSYTPALGYFRQGGVYDPTTKVFTWATGPNAFAVDCQTWCMTVVSPLLIDQWFGAGAAVNIWNKTKELGGFNYQPATSKADGLGFTINAADQVLSGEWTLGGVNMLHVFANYYPGDASKYILEASHMLNTVVDKLSSTVNINGVVCQGVEYANKRYWIPFGWWANPLPSIASTAWTVMVEHGFNPFHLGGAYQSQY